ncbi:MAG: DUF6249 domain-containing protein [Myxococcaceae bacterium]
MPRTRRSLAAAAALLLSFGALPLAMAEEASPEEKAAVGRQADEAGLTDAMVAKMSGEQLHDLLRQKNKDQNVPAVASIAVIGFFAACIFVVAAVLFTIYRTYRQRHDTLRLMVEKGVPIPPELIAPARRPANDLRRGLLLATGGVGLGVFLFAVAEPRGMWTLGLVPLLVGVGYLITWRLTAKAEAPAPRPVES